VLLVALTLLVGPVAEAVAQPPTRPEPGELWRQFPLDSAQSNQKTTDEGRSAPVSSPTSRSTGDEGHDRSQTVQIAAIVLTMALVLILTTGMLAYATHGPLKLRTGLGLRRRFRETGAGLRAALTDEQQHGVASRLRRRLTVAPAAYLRQMRVAVSNFRVRTVSADAQRSANELAILTQTLDTYLARRRESTEDEELEKLKAKLEVRPASTGRPADDQLEILKAKRGKRAAFEVERREEVETLKAKLSRGVEEAKGKAKLDLAGERAEAEAPASVYAGGSGVTAGEPETTSTADSLARTNTGRFRSMRRKG
jgi:hypothetical protein